jgi:UDP-N-acetylglucosamine 2-epimerase
MESLSAMFSSDKYRDVIFLAAGEEQRRKLFSGIKDKNIVITGSPFFDKIADYRPKKSKPKVGKVVTLLPSAYVEYGYIGKDEYFSFIRKFLVQASRVKNVGKVIIKMHPLERHKSTYESIVRSLGLKNVEVVQRPEKEFLYSVLMDSDLLIGAGTTANIEGLMLDKNVMLVDGLAKGTQADLAKIAEYRKAAVVVDKGDDLTAAITKVLTDERVQRELAQKRQRYIANSFYKIDGKAHERVANLIKSLV